MGYRDGTVRYFYILKAILFDNVYIVLKLVSDKEGFEKGAATQNGLDMLYYQAEANWDIWKQLV